MTRIAGHLSSGAKVEWLSSGPSWAGLTAAQWPSGVAGPQPLTAYAFILNLSGSQGNIWKVNPFYGKDMISFSCLSYDRRSSWNSEPGPTDAGWLLDPPGKWEIGAITGMLPPEMSHFLEEDGPGHEVPGGFFSFYR